MSHPQSLSSVYRARYWLRCIPSWSMCRARAHEWPAGAVRLSHAPARGQMPEFCRQDKLVRRRWSHHAIQVCLHSKSEYMRHEGKERQCGGCLAGCAQCLQPCLWEWGLQAQMALGIWRARGDRAIVLKHRNVAATRRAASGGEAGFVEICGEI